MQSLNLSGALNLQAPKSKFLMSRKFSGHPLNYNDYSAVIKDIVEGRYDDQQIADFLVSVSKTLANDETVDLAKARADFSASIDWEMGVSSINTRWAAFQVVGSQ